MADIMTNAQLAKIFEQMISNVSTREDEQQAWFSGTATGGPNGDGYYPITDLDGHVRMEPSPAKIAAMALASQIQGLLSFKTWAELAAHPTAGLTAASGAKVYADAGTHNDPVTAAAGVQNQGVYRYVPPPAAAPGWERIANLEAVDAALSETAAANSKVAAEAAAIQAAATVKVFAVNVRQPNLFTARQLTGHSGPDTVPAASVPPQPGTVNGVPVVHAVSTGGAGQAGQLRFIYYFDAALFRSGVAVAEFTIAQADAGSAAGATRMNFRNAANAVLLSTAPNETLHDQVLPAAPKRITFNPTVLPGGTTRVELDIDVRKLAASAQGRAFDIMDMLMADGNIAGFRPPPPSGTVVNHNPDPRLSGRSATTFQASSAVEGGILTLSLTPGAALNQVIYQIPANSVFAAGYTASFEADIFVDNTTGSNSGDVTWIAYNNVGTEIGRKQVNAAQKDSFVHLRNNYLLPAGTARVDLRYAKRAGSTNFKLRNIEISSDSPEARKVYPVSPSTQPAAAGGPRALYISSAGNDWAAGTSEDPLATMDAALAKLAGDGFIHLVSEAYGEELRFDPTSITGRVEIIAKRTANYAWPVVRLVPKLAGITKTPGRARIYQAAVPGFDFAKANFIWQDDVPDPRTLITSNKRDVEHSGRTHRLPCTRIMKATAATLAAALDEIDTATINVAVTTDAADPLEAIPDPRFFYEAGTLYFTVAGGGDGTLADIRIPSAIGLVRESGKDTLGRLTLRGLDIRYGGLDVRSFKHCEVDEIVVGGAYVNCVDYSSIGGSSLECWGAGSIGEQFGDGLNGHKGSFNAILHYYGHDCMDDAESAHEKGKVRMTGGGLVEFNGGAGLCPATGCDAHYRGFRSRSNCLKRKIASYQVAGLPTEGVDTRAIFEDCIDYDSPIAFYAEPEAAGFGLVIKGRAYDSGTRGYENVKMIDCGGRGNGLLNVGCDLSDNSQDI